MAAGYDLKEGRYDQSLKSVKEIKNAFSKFFEQESKKESTYKYAMMKSIIDCMHTASSKTYKITFDSLFCRFSEIYWVLVFKHRIPQKAPSIKTPETYAEKIVQDIALKYKVKRKTTFSELSNTIRYEMMIQMKKKCSKYVFGALYAETDQLFYSFSKEKQWIKINPLVVDYISKHFNVIQTQNFQAWSMFYKDIIALDNDVSYYQRLLKREFGDNSVILCANPNFSMKKTSVKKIETKSILNAYDGSASKKARLVLQQHPDIGLYIAQISEKIGEDKEIVREILDNSFWSRKEGSRYFYEYVGDEDIVNDAIFQEDEIIESEKYDYITGEIDEEYFRLLDEPEVLIKKMQEEKKAHNEGLIVDQNHSSHVEKNTISTKSMQRKWEREEVVILVVEYFKTKNMSSSEIDMSHRRISELLRRREVVLTGHPVDDTFRNFAGIRMQSSRIRCLDPETSYSGMQGTRIQQEIVSEYLANKQRLIDEAQSIWQKYKLEE